MKTEVAILHNDYPARVRDHVLDKMGQLVRFFEGTVSLRATLERQHDEHRVELVANVRQGIVLVVEGRRDSFSAALDEALARMGRVLRRHKSRLKLERRKVRAH